MADGTRRHHDLVAQPLRLLNGGACRDAPCEPRRLLDHPRPRVDRRPQPRPRPALALYLVLAAAGVRELLLGFVHALVRRTDDLDDARARLRAAIGDSATGAVAGAVGNFEMMNRLLDATGVPTPGSLDDITAELRR